MVEECPWHDKLTDSVIVGMFLCKYAGGFTVQNLKSAGRGVTLLARFTEIGCVFRAPSFPPKIVDAALYNCDFDHGSQLTSHFFRLLRTCALRNMK